MIKVTQQTIVLSINAQLRMVSDNPLNLYSCAGPYLSRTQAAQIEQEQIKSSPSPQTRILLIFQYPPITAQTTLFLMPSVRPLSCERPDRYKTVPRPYEPAAAARP